MEVLGIDETVLGQAEETLAAKDVVETIPNINVLLSQGKLLDPDVSIMGKRPLYGLSLRMEESIMIQGGICYLKWGIHHGYKLNPMTVRLASEARKIEVLEWLVLDQRCIWDRDVLVSAASRGQVDVLELFRQKGHHFSPTIMDIAAKYGQLNTLIWALKIGIPPNKNVCHYAARNNRLDILKWAYDNKFPRDVVTCQFAAIGGHLDILKWLRLHYCPWDQYTCSFAMPKYPELARWALDHGCPCPADLRREIHMATKKMEELLEYSNGFTYIPSVSKSTWPTFIEYNHKSW